MLRTSESGDTVGLPISQRTFDASEGQTFLVTVDTDLVRSQVTNRWRVL